MVEMNETANILNNATDRSLIILDEIGRGTSTFDGISIAWAVAEFIHEKLRARTLFATHYHELTDLALTMDRVKNFNVAIKEWNDQIIFLRKVIEGGADKSYGIQVARLAGLPSGVIERAREVLANLEKAEFDEQGVPVAAPKSRRGDAETGRRGEKADKGTGGQGETADAGTRGRGDAVRERQLGLFAARDANLVREIAELDLNSITPLDAMNKLAEIKKKAEDKA